MNDSEILGHVVKVLEQKLEYCDQYQRFQEPGVGYMRDLTVRLLNDIDTLKSGGRLEDE